MTTRTSTNSNNYYDLTNKKGKMSIIAYMNSFDVRFSEHLYKLQIDAN